MNVDEARANPLADAADDSEWLRAQPASEATDSLLMGYADATAYIGDLRYSKQQERIPQLEAALAAAERQGNRADEGRFLGNLGLAYADLGDARKAIEFYEQQLVIVREIGDRRGEGNALGNLGSAYARLGDLQGALAYAEQAYRIMVAIESPYAAQVRTQVEWLQQQLAGPTEVQSFNPLVTQPLINFLNAQAVDEIRAIVDAHPALLTADVGPVFDALLQQYQADEDAVNMITFKRDVLQACIEQSVDEVFAELAQRLAASEEPDEPTA